MSKKLKYISWIAILSMIFIVFGSVNNITASLKAQSSTARYKVEFITPDSFLMPTEAREALIEAVQIWNQTSPLDDTFLLVNIEWYGDWALGTLATGAKSSSTLQEGSIDAHSVSHGDLIAFIAVLTPSDWQAALDIDSRAQILLSSIPDSELSTQAKQAIFPQDITLVRSVIQRQSYFGYKFPWKSSEPWHVTQGWHGSGDTALDFVPNGLANSEIRASATGIVTVQCVQGIQSAIGIKTDSTNESIQYVHINSSTLAVIQGQRVAQGQYLGKMVQGNVNESPCAYSEGTHIHINFQQKPFTIDNLTFSDANYHSGEQLFSTNGTSANATSWNFANNLNGWGQLKAFDFQGFGDGGAIFDIPAIDPWIISAPINASAASIPYLHIYMASQVDNCGQVFWRRTSDAGFSDERFLPFTPDNTGGTSLNVLDMSSHPNWNGTIAEIRLDPACNPNEAPNGVRLNIVDFESEGCTDADSWNFNVERFGWQEAQSLTFLGHSDGGMVYEVTGLDPQIESPVLCNLKAENYYYLQIKMASQVDTCGQLFWRGANDTEFSETRTLGFDINPNSNTQIITIPIGEHAEWKGNITHLRLDPACNSGEDSNGVRIDKISFTNDSGEANLVTNGGFEISEPGSSWNGSGKQVCNKPDKIVAKSGQCALRMKGLTGISLKLTQKIPNPDVLSGDILTFHAWMATKKMKLEAGRIRATVIYSDGTKNTSLVLYPLADTTEYSAYQSSSLVIEKTVSKIKVQIRITDTGSFWLDDLSLTRQSIQGIIPLPLAP